MNSTQKGKKGERELALFLRGHGWQARRGQQFNGSPDSPDVVSNLPFHIECKRVERLNLRDAVAQAEGDSGSRPWLVFHRWNNGQWLVTLLADEFLKHVEPEQTQHVCKT